MRRDDLDAAVTLYLATVPDWFLASGGGAFLRAYFRVWLESPTGMAFVATASPDGPIAGLLLGALVPGQHYRWMTRRGVGPIGTRLLIHALRHPPWGVWLVRTRGVRYVRGVLRMFLWTQRRRGLDDEGWPGSRVAEVTHLVVSPQWQGRGVGSELLCQAERSAVAAGVERLSVVTPLGWAAADFYARLGWVNCGQTVSRSHERFIRFELPLSARVPDEVMEPGARVRG